MPWEREFYVYIMANKIGGTLYVGMTNNLIRRVWEHKNGVGSSFTKQHNIAKLIYFEIFDAPEPAFQRERNIKRWKRAWKVRLIEERNPDWLDLYFGLT